MRKSFCFIQLIAIASLTSFGQSKTGMLFYNGEFKELIQQVQSNEATGKASIEDWSFAAKSCEQLYDYQSSVYYWQKVLEIDSVNAKAIEGIADSYANLGNFRDAYDYYQMMLPSDTSDVLFWGKYAGVLSGLDRYEQAANVYSKLLAINPENLFFLRKRAVAVYNTKNFPQSVGLFKHYLELNPTDIQIWTALATCLQRLEKDAEAIKALEGILAIDSTHLTTLSKIAYINFNNLRKYENALYYYRMLNRLTGSSDAVWLANQAICEYFAGDVGFAASTLDSLSYILTSNVFVNFYAGLSYCKQGDTDKGLMFVETASKMAIPAYLSDIYHHIGRIYSQKRLFKEAITAYEKSIEINPVNYIAYYDLALAHEEFNRNSAVALAYYQQYLKENPNLKSPEIDYASNRVKRIKEELFFDGE